MAKVHRTDTWIKYVRGSQPYDAIITDRSQYPPIKMLVEITHASMGDEEYLRRKYADSNGKVPMTGKICRGKAQDIKVTQTAPGHGELIGTAVKQVKDAIRRKASKRYAQGMVLLVLFDDYLLEDADVDYLGKEVAIEMSSLERTFAVIYILGKQRRTALALNRPTSSDATWAILNLSD